MLKWIKRIAIALLSIIIIVLAVLWISFYFWKSKLQDQKLNETSILNTSKGEIEYILKGEEENTILMIHGSPGSVHVADTAFYLKNGYSILSVSRPGYFETPLKSGETPLEQAILYKFLLDHLEIEEVFINGISGGGPSAIQFAIDYPKRTKGLILRAAIAEPLHREIIEKGIIQKFFETEFGMWLGVQLMMSQLDDESKERTKAYAELGVFPFSKTMEGLENDENQFVNMKAQPLEDIAVPTLLIHGTADQNVPYKSSESAHDRISDSKLFKMEGKDHFAFWSSYADTINSEILEFLVTVDSKNVSK